MAAVPESKPSNLIVIPAFLNLPVLNLIQEVQDKLSRNLSTHSSITRIHILKTARHSGLEPESQYSKHGIQIYTLKIPMF
jgi:hypothetical protein